MKPMAAEHPGKCAACDEAIEPGDPIIYDDDVPGWVHAEYPCGPRED